MRFFRISSLEVVEEAHRSADEDGEGGYGDCRLRLKLEEGDEHRDCDSAATNAGHCAESHDKTEDEYADPFKRFLREDIFVLAFLVTIANEIGVVGAIAVDLALITLITQRSVTISIRKTFIID